MTITPIRVTTLMESTPNTKQNTASCSIYTLAQLQSSLRAPASKIHNLRPKLAHQPPVPKRHER
jgi:hypothetical protein